MPSPIILGFQPGDSLSSMDSLVIGAGATWGNVKMPFVPLLFTPERLANAIWPLEWIRYWTFKTHQSDFLRPDI